MQQGKDAKRQKGKEAGRQTGKDYYELLGVARKPYELLGFGRNS